MTAEQATVRNDGPSDSEDANLKSSFEPAPRPILSHTEKGWRVNLFRAIPILRWLVGQRWFQFAVILPNLAFFLLFLVAGVWGSPVGNANVIIVFVWIFWWFLLIAIMVPFMGRVWCLVCPFPFFGEWIQRGALVMARTGRTVGLNRYYGLNLRWPKKLANIWIQNIGFLTLCTFSVSFLTRPIVSVGVLGGLFVAATILHLIYRQRAFCNYVCPVSGFLSLYSMTSMVEVRSEDKEVCRSCKGRNCLAGSDQGWGCPWSMYPSKMERNNYCGLCMECVKTCPHDNMALNLRPFCSDSQLKGYDEAWKAFIMMALALAYSAIYIGPWGVLKDAANVFETGRWLPFLIYVAGLWGGALVLLPAGLALCVYLGRKLSGVQSAPWKEVFLVMSYPFVPLGLFAWIAFSTPLIFVNGSYILVVLSDPLGWGWDLFGTAGVTWSPIVPHWMPYFQVPLLLLGLYYALKTGISGARELYADPSIALRSFIPTAIYLGVVVITFLGIYVR